jgi:hypothetical protein
MAMIKTCEVCGITSETKEVRYHLDCGKYLCSKHIAQMKRYGRITDPTQRTTHDKNEIVQHADYAEMIIRNKRNEIVAKTIFDLNDVEKVSARKWNVLPSRGKLYIYSKYPKHLKLHRLITGYYGPLEIDHINRNTLDNRKSNLRIVTRSENASNIDAKHIRQVGNTWMYEIVRFGKRFRKSGFKTREDASVALQNCLSDVSRRVNELIDQFNKQNEINPFKGVYRRFGKYQAVYYHKGKKYYAGTFETPSQAFEARNKLISRLNLE